MDSVHFWPIFDHLWAPLIVVKISRKIPVTWFFISYVEGMQRAAILKRDFFTVLFNIVNDHFVDTSHVRVKWNLNILLDSTFQL